MIVKRNDMKKTVADLLRFFDSNCKKNEYELKIKAS
jgi:acetyl-CoA carboxylase carboxyl transferase subunit beta